MNIIKYKKWIIAILLFYVTTILLIVIQGLFITAEPMTNITTGNYWLDIILVFISIPLCCIAAFYLGGILLSPILIYFHKKIIGKKYVYGIEQMPHSQIQKSPYKKALAPALLTIHFGLLFINFPWVQNLILTPEVVSSGEIHILLILMLLFTFPITASVSTFLYSATYFLLDSGIIYSTKNLDTVREGSNPVEVGSIGAWFYAYLSGFTGLSVIYDFLTIILPYLFALIDNLTAFMINIVWILMPFGIAILIVPVIIIKDTVIHKRKNFLSRTAEKLGITGKLIDPLGEQTER